MINIANRHPQLHQLLWAKQIDVTEGCPEVFFSVYRGKMGPPSISEISKLQKRSHIIVKGIWVHTRLASWLLCIHCCRMYKQELLQRKISCIPRVSYQYTKPIIVYT